MDNLQKMGKTSYKRMKDLSKKIHKKIDKLEDGKLHLDEIEELVNDTRDLYERLVVVKFKAYEKYGEPSSAKEEEIVEEVKEVVEEVIPEKEPVKEEAPFDFSEGITETEVEQPAFDFDLGDDSTQEEPEPIEEEPAKESIEPEPLMVKSDDVTVKTHEEPKETFPKADDVKTNTSDIFMESHVEKHEPEDVNTLNSQLKAEEEESLRKKLQKTPIADLKSEISIAKKFEYITFMFDGKNELYEEAINALNSCSNGDEAKDKLNEFSTKYNWDLENKSIMKFVELVERRYL